jgi:hypothetical protein
MVAFNVDINNIDAAGIQQAMDNLARQRSTREGRNELDAFLASTMPYYQSYQEPAPSRQPDPDPAPATVVNIYTKKELGGWIRTYREWSDGRVEQISEERNRSAGDAIQEMFQVVGLDASFAASLTAVIDNLYNTNVDPNKSQILNAVYNSEAYKQRFKANEAIKQRIADGQGRPGDRMLTPAEYIAAENQYRTILQDADMPEGYYDTPDDFTNLIANSISASEFKSRVDTAYDALNYADANVVNSLQNYYNLSKSDLVAYLLDPARAMPVLEGRASTAGAFGMNNRTELEKMYRSAQVGGAAERQGLDVGRSMSEEIVGLNKDDQAESAFAAAGAADSDLQRLGKLYGESMDFKDLVKETLNLSGGVTSGRKRRKFASKERAAFNQQGALDRRSLSKMTDV